MHCGQAKEACQKKKQHVMLFESVESNKKVMSTGLAKKSHLFII